MAKEKIKTKKTKNNAAITVVREIIIILLLTLAIILILGVAIYQYIPTNKIIPETVAYTTPENVKTELQTDENVDTSEVVVTYQIDSTDLSNYKKIQEYVPGKKNPFSSVTQSSGETTGNTTTGNSSSSSNSSENSNNSTTGTTNSNSSTTNTTKNTGYLPDKGTK